MKYQIIKCSNSIKYVAGSKAVQDATKIAESKGYKTLHFLKKRSTSRLYEMTNFVYNFIKVYLTTRPSDSILLQWPLYIYGIKQQFILHWVKNRTKDLNILIHDLDFIRYEGQTNEQKDFECEVLSHARSIIVHSDEMEQVIRKNGINTTFHNLGVFDYLTQEESPARRYSYEVAYAGNLEKSTFLSGIAKENTLGITLNCYGASNPYEGNGIVYKGRFAPDNTSALEGSWGLVWDGESADSCSGLIGDYLRINSPHKSSLYLVAGLPIIVWKEAAIAKYVTEKGIGIVVSSLDEIHHKISEISDTEYEQMLGRVRKEAEAIRNGERLEKILNQL